MAQSDDVAGRVEFYKAQLHSSELRCSSEHAHVEQLQSEVEKLSTRYGESTASVATVTAEMTRLQGQVEVLQEELDKVTGMVLCSSDLIMIMATYCNFTNFRCAFIFGTFSASVSYLKFQYTEQTLTHIVQ